MLADKLSDMLERPPKLTISHSGVRSISEISKWEPKHQKALGEHSFSMYIGFSGVKAILLLGPQVLWF
jgi:hypothetical protein